MIPFNTLRTIIFGWVLFCALLGLGLNGYAVSQTSGVVESSNLGVATSVLTLAFIGTLLAFGILRTDSALTMVSVDLGVVFFLMIMWLSTGAYLASQYSCSIPVITDPTGLGLRRRGIYGCFGTAVGGASKGAAAFAFLAFFPRKFLLCLAYPTITMLTFLPSTSALPSPVLGYWGLLLTYAIKAVQRGNSYIWQTPVPQADFAGGPSEKFNHNQTNHFHTPQQNGMGAYQQYPPAPQFTGGSNV
ncbi:uncharacterized protein EI90DRAFT_3118176 [Cantharellus anzutake]|uniref:uncharacterized protein n=1 Tax=Cantharellus anzutake TaxID=1750568 RepID=UPI0019035645|nr:uncharacterized protein EI90DRAFT_3118176 [Cantharellus anzutake]KAF8339089.1 hypothetical protein EI90DRAFT_3118176 [Cantharellus anzutake]